MELKIQLQTDCNTNRNLMAVQVLSAIGFEHINILKALPKLTGLTHPEAARRVGCTRQAVTHTMNCIRVNRDLQEKLADTYGVPVDILFPEARGGT